MHSLYFPYSIAVFTVLGISNPERTWTLLDIAWPNLLTVWMGMAHDIKAMARIETTVLQFKMLLSDHGYHSEWLFNIFC